MYWKFSSSKLDAAKGINKVGGIIKALDGNESGSTDTNTSSSGEEQKSQVDTISTFSTKWDMSFPVQHAKNLFGVTKDRKTGKIDTVRIFGHK